MTAHDLLRKITTAMYDQDVLDAVEAWEDGGYQGIRTTQGGRWLCCCEDADAINPASSPKCDQCGWTRPTP